MSISYRDIHYLFLTIIYNIIPLLSYYPLLWKFVQIIMVPKPGKPVAEVTSYRSISLLPILSKVFEKLLKRLRSDIDFSTLLPDHQFGFRTGHSTIHQIHRVAQEIAKGLEGRELCTAAFLDVAQAFDKVWHTGLLYKQKTTLPCQYYLLLKTYLQERHFQVKHNQVYSTCHEVRAGVPQFCVHGPAPTEIYTADLPTTEHTTIATFADDTGLLAAHADPLVASQHLQHHLNILQEWADTWKIKINQAKSVHITFTTKRTLCPPVTMNNDRIPMQSAAKYLGLQLDQRLTWSTHIKTKRQHQNIKLRDMYWLLGRKSKLSLRINSFCINVYSNQCGRTVYNSGAVRSRPIQKSSNACDPRSCDTQPMRRGMSPTSRYTPIYAYPSLLRR
jgi:hypothetical protein